MYNQLIFVCNLHVAYNNVYAGQLQNSFETTLKFDLRDLLRTKIKVHINTKILTNGDETIAMYLNFKELINQPESLNLLHGPVECRR